MTTPDYVWEKLHLGVNELAAGDAPLRERLASAWEQIGLLEPDDFPEGKSREQLETLRERLSRGEGADTTDLSDAAAANTAETIVSLYDRSARSLDPVHSE